MTDPGKAIILPFAIAETIIWAACYYVFPALLPEWEATMGWSRTELSTAFSTAILISALLAPTTGHLIDQGHGRTVFTGCTLLGGLILIALAQTTQFWQFYLLWTAMGVCMAGALYEACFAIVTRSTTGSAKRAITRITLIAGLAGTVSFPTANALTALVGWRGTLLIFAAITILIAAPLVWTASTRAEQQHAASQRREPARNHPPSRARQTLKSPAFWLLAIAFTSIAIDHGGIIAHMLLILDDRGISQTAAITAAAMIGPMQVTGRLAMMAAERHLSIMTIATGCFIALLGAAICLLFANGAIHLIAAFVILQGAGYGVTSIARPVLTAELLGKQSFGIISGMLALPFMIGFAAAPTLTALAWEAGGYDLAIILTIAIILTGLVSILAAQKLARQTTHGR